jgi:hypothetical protein
MANGILVLILDEKERSIDNRLSLLALFYRFKLSLFIKTPKHCKRIACFMSSNRRGQRYHHKSLSNITQFTTMANAVQYLSPSRRKVSTLRCRNGEQKTPKREKEIIKLPVSKDHSDRKATCPQDKSLEDSRKLLPVESWNDSAAYTLDLLDSSFGRLTPPSSVDARDLEIENAASRNTSIRWSTIDIHVHEKGLGASVPSTGPPVGIGWQAVEHIQVSIDDYEQQRPPRRIRMEMLTPSRSRQDELLDSGLSLRELRDVCLEVATIRQQRRKSSKDGRLLRRVVQLLSWKPKPK